MSTFVKAIALSTLLAVGAHASANAAIISGSGPLGSFTGTLTYTAATNTSATLVVSLTNTSPLANGGYLVAFVLNNPGDLITAVDVTSGLNFSELGLDNGGVNGAPYGQFDFGASIGNGFEGGGNPSGGIAAGDSRSIVFSLTGVNLLSLSDASFLSTLSTGTGAGKGYQDFVARFRGFDDDGSDKVPNGPPIDVPEPGTLALLGAALAGLGLLRRRTEGLPPRVPTSIPCG